MKFTLAEALMIIDMGMLPEEYEKMIWKKKRLLKKRDELLDWMTVLLIQERFDEFSEEVKKLNMIYKELEGITV